MFKLAQPLDRSEFNESDVQRYDLVIERGKAIHARLAVLSQMAATANQVSTGSKPKSLKPRETQPGQVDRAWITSLRHTSGWLHISLATDTVEAGDENTNNYRPDKLPVSVGFNEEGRMVPPILECFDLATRELILGEAEEVVSAIEEAAAPQGLQHG